MVSWGKGVSIQELFYYPKLTAALLLSKSNMKHDCGVGPSNHTSYSAVWLSQTGGWGGTLCLLAPCRSSGQCLMAVVDPSDQHVQGMFQGTPDCLTATTHCLGQQLTGDGLAGCLGC